MPTRRFPRFAPLAFVAALTLAFGLLAPMAQAVDLAGATSDLALLKKATKSKGTNADLKGYLEAVFTDYRDLQEAPDKPADDAADEEKKLWEAENKKFEKARDKFRKDARKLLLKILTLKKIKSKKDPTNQRDDANIKAAEILGQLKPLLSVKEASTLSGKIMGAIDKDLVKAKYDVNSEHIIAAFASLGKLNDPKSLAWMLDKHCHANDVKKPYIIGAHKAMVLFKDVPGKLRYEVVSHFVKVYGGVELQAERSSTDAKDLAKKRFWDDIKTDTIPVAQYYAGKPTDADGSALATMADFTAFMRQHKNIRKAPWADAKVKK